MGFEPTTSSLGSWHSTTELRPQPYFLQLSKVTLRRQVLLDSIGYAFNPFGCRYLPANREETASESRTNETMVDLTSATKAAAPLPALGSLIARDIALFQSDSSWGMI